MQNICNIYVITQLCNIYLSCKNKKIYEICKKNKILLLIFNGGKVENADEMSYLLEF